jgi:hypothetical protein
MPWAKLDENFHSHPKSYMIGLDGCGLFAKCLSYCAHYLTDGFVPEEWVYAQVPATRRCRDTNGVVEKLIAAHMLRPVEGGFVIDDYLDHNPSREQYEAHKADVSSKRREAGRRGGQANRKQTPKQNASKTEANDQANGVAKSKPVPVPTTEVGVVPQQQQVAPEAAAALHPALGDVLAIAQEAAGRCSTLLVVPEAVEMVLRMYPGADHLMAAREAAADFMAGTVTRPHFHTWLKQKLAHQKPKPKGESHDDLNARRLAALRRLEAERGVGDVV